jgi:hypothetical protein
VFASRLSFIQQQLNLPHYMRVAKNGSAERDFANALILAQVTWRSRHPEMLQTICSHWPYFEIDRVWEWAAG